VTGSHTRNQDIDELPCRNSPGGAAADARATGKRPQKVERVHRQADLAGCVARSMPLPRN